MNENMIKSDLLVVGAGIAGLTAAVEAAETGLSVTLLEKRPYVGGKVTQFNKYFPKLCPPSCGLEINLRRLRTNPAIRLLTLATVIDVSGKPGKYRANVRLSPRFVTSQCTSCGECVSVCPKTRKNEFNYGMDETASIYLPYQNAYPERYVIDPATCEGSSCSKCVDACKYGAIDLSEKEKVVEIEAGAVVWATGWEPYDPNKLDVLGFGQFPDVITNVMMERLASPDGPTKGRILRPSTLGEVGEVAFVQCAGSRDENHLEYCSSVCCMASLKHVRYIREQYPDAEIHIHYIDVRSSGFFEDFYGEVRKDEKVHFHRGKVAKVSPDPSSDKLIVEAEDTMKSVRLKESVDLVVLATGMKPAVDGLPVPPSSIDSNGFLISDSAEIIGCGVSKGPKDVSAVVQEATGSVLKAIQVIKGN